MSIVGRPSTTNIPSRQGGRGLQAGLRSLWSGLLLSHPGTTAQRRPGWFIAAGAGNAHSQRAPGWIEVLRRWSPGFVPPALGGLLLVIVAQLASRHDGRGAPLIAPSTLLPLFIFYLLAGILYGVLLYVAPTLGLWMLALVAGVALYLLVTAAFIWGIIGVVVVAVFLAALSTFYVRGHLVTVPDHHVQITALGGYARTLQPGAALLLPTERIVATLDLADHTVTCPARQVRIESGEGIMYVARASATVVYHILPGRAHHAFLASDNVDNTICTALAAAVEDALATWAIHMLDDDDPPHERFIATQVLQRLRGQTTALGIHLRSVNIQGIRLLPESETIPAHWSPAPAPASDPPTVPRHPRLPPASPLRDVGATASTAPATPPPLPDTLTPDVLSAAYEAVREGRISDPTTIRTIANGFLAVAANPALNATFPYDALAAAHILLDLVHTLERGDKPAASSH